MWVAIKSAWALLVGIGFIMLGNGLQGTLLGVRASSEDFGDATTGIIMSGYYVGFFLGSIIVPKFVSRVGHIRVFAALATIASSTVLIHAVFVDPVLWMVMRVVTGFAYAGLYIVAESWLNEVATNKTRGTLLSIYMVVSMGAVGAGQFMLVLSDPDGFVLFILVSVIVSCSLVPLAISTSRAPGFDKPSRISLREIFDACPTGVLVSFLNGLGFGAIFSIGAVYARAIGFSLGETSVFMAASFIAPVFVLWPIGALSDRLDRRLVIFGIAVISAAAAGAVALLTAEASFIWLVIAFGTLGAFSTPIYSLCIAYTNDYLEYEQMVAASAKLVLVNGLGAVAGPVTVATAMSWYGDAAFGWTLGAIYGAIALFVAYRMTVRSSLPSEDQTSYVAVSPRGSMVAAIMTADEMEETGSDNAETDKTGTGEDQIKISETA